MNIHIDLLISGSMSAVFLVVWCQGPVRDTNCADFVMTTIDCLSLVYMLVYQHCE
jgi:hypothetical protein